MTPSPDIQALAEAAEIALTWVPPGEHRQRGVDAVRALVARCEELERERDIWKHQGGRKIEAYDAARARVKREGYSRAEYVLRAEAAEARAKKLEAALREIAEITATHDEWMGLDDMIEIARAALADAGGKEEA